MNNNNRLKKIGFEKATKFNKNFDECYDYWKDIALNKFNYKGELKLIKEHNKIFIYIILPIEF
jgi:hypothetical protein